MAEDFYELLGVDPDASEDAILRAYRKRAAELHPDVSDEPDAGEAFQRLNRAKSVLTDAEKRQAYDRLGHDRFMAEVGHDDGRRKATQSGAPGSGGSMDSVGAGTESWPDQFDSFIESLFAGTRIGGGPPLGDRFGHTDARSAPFTVDLSAYLRRLGAPTDPRADRPDQSRGGRECPKCGGRGTFVHDIDTGHGRRRRLEDCERCGGTGTVSG